MIKKTLLKLQGLALRGFRYGKWIGILWLASFVLMAPIAFLIGGWHLLLGYIICKLTGACPI